MYYFFYTTYITMQFFFYQSSHKNTLHIGAVVVADILIILTYVKSR